jgi:acyl-CoA synthetase (AMP-forming)/AMP-acid ligase II
MNIARILAERAASSPGVAAIVDTCAGKTRTTDYRALDGQAARIAAVFAGAGLRRGDTLLVFHPMSMELYAVLLGAFRIGVVAMFVDPSAGRAHIGRCCELRPPDAFLGTPRAHLLRLVVPALRRVPRNFTTSGWVPGATNLWRAPANGSPAIEDSGDGDAALITFTSGSTGQPKGIVRTHGFLLAQHRALERSLDYRAGQIDLTTLPVFLLANLASGLTSVVPDVDLRYPGHIDAGKVMRQIDEQRTERTAASPAFVERLLEHCERTGRNLGSLNKVYVGGAPVFPDLILRVQRLLVAGGLVAVYGSTEAEPIAHVDAHDISTEDLRHMAEGRGLLTGAPVSEVELRIISDRWGRPIGPYTRDSFEAQRLAVGETGEIVVRGDHVVAGYLNGMGEQETKFEVDGRRWHRTGDLGYLDDAGRLWLMGRCAASIKDARGVLHPFAVECAALQQDAVARAALVAQDDRRVLVVQPRPGRTPVDGERIRAAMSWARLDRVVLCPRIPMDRRHNAKVDYPALREWLAAQRDDRA